MDAGISKINWQEEKQAKTERLDLASNASDGFGLIKKVIKSSRKIFHSILFPENGAIANFFDKNPVITRIYYVTQISSVLTLFRTPLKIKKAVKQIIHGEGLQRFDAATKVISQIGKTLGAIVTIVAGLESFKLGKQLGAWGFRAAEKFFESSSSWGATLGLVGAFLSIASLVHKVITLTQVTKIKNLLEPFHKTDDHQGFQQACETHATLLNKQIDLSKDLPLEKLNTKEAAEIVVGRLKLLQKVAVVNVITKAISTAAIAVLFVPGLEPLALVLLTAASIAKLVTKIWDNYNQYHLERSLGLIETPPLNTWSAKLWDFAKWEMGWYENYSRGSRLVNSTVTTATGLTIPLALLGDILIAVSAVFKFFK